MERLLKYKFSTATLGEKKANVKQESCLRVTFSAQPLHFQNYSRSIPQKLLEPSSRQAELRAQKASGDVYGNPGR
jgi:hypothetical protein